MQMMPPGGVSITPGTIEIEISGQNGGSGSVQVGGNGIMPPGLANFMSTHQWITFKQEVNEVMSPMDKIKLVRAAVFADKHHARRVRFPEPDPTNACA